MKNNVLSFSFHAVIIVKGIIVTHQNTKGNFFYNRRALRFKVKNRKPVSKWLKNKQWQDSARLNVTPCTS